MKLNMVMVLVDDWAKSVDWYEQVLGLRVLVREDDHEFCLLGFPEGDATLALHPAGGGPGGSRCVPNIQVGDLDGVVEALRVRGVEFDGGIRGGDEGYRIVTFLDPSGNRLQLYEFTR